MDPEVIQQGIQASGSGFHILVKPFIVDKQAQGTVGAVDMIDGGSQVAKGAVQVLDGFGDLRGGQAGGGSIEVVQGMGNMIVIFGQVAGELQHRHC